MARPCPCGRKLTFETCCGPRLSGAVPAPTAVDLMRSRFTAYGEGAVAYLIATTAPETREALDAAELTAYCAALRLVKLEILETQAGAATDDAGFVTFRATLRHRGEKFTQTERSRFRREAGAWLYVDGDPLD
jgi:SEC-C motif-containing protein